MNQAPFPIRKGRCFVTFSFYCLLFLVHYCWSLPGAWLSCFGTKVSKEADLGEALTVKAIDTAFLVVPSYPDFKLPFPKYPSRPLRVSLTLGGRGFELLRLHLGRPADFGRPVKFTEYS